MATVRRVIVGCTDRWGACRRCATRRTKPGSGTCRWCRSSPGSRRAGTWPSAGIPRPTSASWRDAAWERLRTAFDDGLGGFPADLRVEPHVERGETGPVLVDVAGQPEDLLVIGTGRRDVLRRLCRSSVGRYCLAHSKCPVLAVPPSALMDELGHGLRSWHLRRHVLLPGPDPLGVHGCRKGASSGSAPDR